MGWLIAIIVVAILYANAFFIVNVLLFPRHNPSPQPTAKEDET